MEAAEVHGARSGFWKTDRASLHTSKFVTGSQPYVEHCSPLEILWNTEETVGESVGESERASEGLILGEELGDVEGLIVGERVGEWEVGALVTVPSH